MKKSQLSFFTQIATSYLDKSNEKTLFWQAINRMSKARDPLHDERHIESMLNQFHELLTRKELLINRQTQKETVLAIAWHDVWISQFTPTWSVKIWFIQMIEGLACMHIFQREAKKSHLPNRLQHAVSYAIRKHSNYQLFDLKTEAARILYDLDWLEFYSVDRFKHSIAVFKKNGLHFIFEWSWLHAFFGNLYMKLRAHKPEAFYHVWAQDQFIKSREEFFRYADHFRQEAKKNSYLAPILKFF